MKNLSIFAAGAVSALVLGSGVAVGATGGSFILGRANSAGATTTLTNKSGTALTLASKAGTPSLKVSTPALVAKLNADLVDGKSAADFASAKAKSGYIDAQGEWMDVDDDGQVDFLVAVAQCPTGTVLTGGGFGDYTDAGQVFDSSPLGQNAWFVAVLGDPSADTGDDAEAYAICLNVRGGSITGSAPTARSGATGSDSLASKLRLKGH